MRILIITLACLMPLLLTAQDLEQAWQDYSQVRAELERVELQQREVLEEQSALREEIQSLKENASWYNSWFNKLLIASRTERQVQLLETLNELDLLLDPLREQQEQSLGHLKASYGRLVRDHDPGTSLPDETREVARRIGRLLQNTRTTNQDLPDYSALVNDSYPDPTLRRMVLQDVQQLITAKLSLMDSLIRVAQEEEELADRLSAFHEDLGLQAEAGQDNRSNTDNAAASSFSWESADEERLDAGNDAILDAQSIPNAESRALRVERQDMITSSGSPKSQLQVLEDKKRSYETLLQQVQEALNIPQ